MGDGISGYDIYAKNGATAWFGDNPGSGSVWTSQAITNHDAWPTWNPDTPDWYQYSLNLYQDSGIYKWSLRNHPGSTDTDMNPANGPAADGQRAATATGRYGTPEEVADLVAFLAGPAGRSVTGADWLLDNGANA